MIKYFLTVAFAATTSFAGLIGGVSMTVDSEPITLYEIQSFVAQNKVPVEEAVNRLVQKKIEDIEIRELGIIASPYEIDNKIKELAAQNKMSLEQFKQELTKEGLTENDIKAKIEEQYKRDTLYKKIVGSSLKKPDEEELKSYYETHQKEFNFPTKVEVIEYLAESKEALEVVRKQPMINQPNVQVTPKTVDLKSINPQLAGLLLNTKNKTFTPVLTLGKISGMFFVIQRAGQKHISYEEAKQSIFARVLKAKEQAALIEYFEKKKSEANIKIVRRPN